jgi:ABC-type transporter Mla MlaB component
MGSSAPQTVAFAIRGPIAPTDLPGLSERISALLRECGAGVVHCDVQGLEPDAVTVEALCRLQVAAGRHGCRVRLRHASAELLELVAFMGLTEVFPDS